MKKILLSLGLMSLMVSNSFGNEIIKDENGLNNINVKITTTKFDSIGLGVENKLTSSKLCLPIIYGVDIEYFKQNGNQNKEAQIILNTGLLLPQFVVWNNLVNGVVGVEVINELIDNKINGIKTHLSPKIGVLLNDRLYLGYRLEDSDTGVKNTFNLFYSF